MYRCEKAQVGQFYIIPKTILVSVQRTDLAYNGTILTPLKAETTPHFPKTVPLWSRFGYPIQGHFCSFCTVFYSPKWPYFWPYFWNRSFWSTLHIAYFHFAFSFPDPFTIPYSKFFHPLSGDIPRVSILSTPMVRDWKLNVMRKGS